METLWFCCVALMLTLYVVLDGFDIGAGIAHLIVARSDDERRTVIGTIGPVWDGNEVWLLAAGGTLYFAFPALYASSFSGFYLPLMMVLWLLILRGLSIELRSHVASDLFKTFWDAGFSLSSALLAVFFGAALGNVIRGVPLDASGYFFLPLWTNFQPGRDPGILDWYTIPVGVTALVVLTMHGALWVALKTEGELHARASRLARTVWPMVAALTLIITGASFRIQPHLRAAFSDRPWGYVFPFIALAGLLAVRFSRGWRFFGSCTYIIGMLASAAFGVYPYVLPSNGDPALGLDVYNSSAAHYGLSIGLRWWIPGMLLAGGYFAFVYRKFAGKVGAPDKELGA
jgi:cytochrome d ubiquinol oxidase subunit II